MSKCVKCDTECGSDAKDNISCVECGDVLHVSCAGVSLTKITRNRPFKCDKCKKDSASISSVSDSEESNIIKAINSLRSDFTNTLDKKLTKMEEKINESNGKIGEIEKRIDEWQESLNVSLSDIKSENVVLRKDCDNLALRCDDLSRQVAALTDSLHDLQQHSRIDNLEIAGIPLTTNEDVYAVLQAVAKVINTPWRREDVSIAHRLPARRQSHPSIVVKFISRTAKSTWLQAARKLKQMTANMLHKGFPNTPVYINQHLAGHVKATLSRAKQLVRDKRLAYAWISEGKVLVRKTAEGKASRVRSVADVEAVAAGEQQRTIGGGSGSPDTRGNGTAK